MFIMSNIEAMQSYLDFKKIDLQFNKSLAKLSSGLNAPTPNAGSEWVIANDMEAQYRQYTIASEHVQNALGVLEIAQQTMMEINDMILRMDELAHRAASEEINNDQRLEMAAEFSSLRDNISSLLAEVKYNDINVWSNNVEAKTFSILVGRSQYIQVSSFDMSAGNIGYSGATLGSTIVTAQLAISQMKSTIVTMNQLMAQMGGQIRQVEGKVNIIDEQAVQQKAMQARINELDFAKEMKSFTSLQVVLQSSNAMLAQANMKSQLVLQLFGG